MAEPNPFLAGLRGRCPRCGEGRLFSRYLTIADTCAVCGLDFRTEDAGDGPAVFIMFAVGFIVVPLALMVEVEFTPPFWLHMVLWIPVCLGLILAMLPPFKATMFALQHKHGAHEGRIDDDDDATA